MKTICATIFILTGLLCTICIADPLDPIEVQPTKTYQVMTLKGPVIITEIRIDAEPYLLIGDHCLIPKTQPRTVSGSSHR